MRSFLPIMRAVSLPRRLAPRADRLSQKRRSLRRRCQSTCGDTSSQVLWTINCLEGVQLFCALGSRSQAKFWPGAGNAKSRRVAVSEYHASSKSLALSAAGKVHRRGRVGEFVGFFRQHKDGIADAFLAFGI